MDIEQGGYKIGVGGVDLLVKEISPVKIEGNEVDSQESQYGESL